MNVETIRDYCLSKPGATEDCAFGPENILFRICGKIFACIDLERPWLVVLKGEPNYAEELRDRYLGITPAWHWNDVRFDADVDDETILAFVDHSYNEVVKKLPKKTLYNFPDLPAGWHHEHLPEVDTTMNYIREPEVFGRPAEFELITADFQTCGHGQKGTVWESERGENLLFAFRFRPEICDKHSRCKDYQLSIINYQLSTDATSPLSANQQFLISEIVALAVHKALSRYVEPSGLTVKWPNDVYFGDKKICGMLIEHNLRGANIASTVVGVGINVGQTTFKGDAPNPISIKQITGGNPDRSAVLRNFLKHFMDFYALLKSAQYDKVHNLYKQSLYRLHGAHRYRDARGEFTATIEDVKSNGLLVLRDTTGQVREYAFKEVEYK